MLVSDVMSCSVRERGRGECVYVYRKYTGIYSTVDSTCEILFSLFQLGMLLTWSV